MSNIKDIIPYVIICTMSALIAVDIGGTTMRAASYPTNSLNPIKINKIHRINSSKPVFQYLLELIQSVWVDSHEVLGLSIASPGPLDPETGFIFNAPNLPGWVDFPLGEKLRDTISVPLFFGNDANLAAFGEWKYGAGIGHSNLIYLTISTGIGGGVICNGNLLTGHKGLAAELGHIIIQPDGPLCSCGKRGHLEAIASGPAIVSYANDQIKNGQPSSLAQIIYFSAVDVAYAARNGDELAIKSIERAGETIGLALASFVHIFNPSIIILGGGVTMSGNLLFDPLLQKFRSEIMEPIYSKDLEIVPAKLGDDSGLLGALAFARNQLEIN